MSTPSKDRELRENYCFHCGAHGNSNSPLCFNCGQQIGTYPPEVEALITSKIDSLKQSLVAEMPKRQELAMYFDRDKNIRETCYTQGFNEATKEANQAITKVFNGRM
jgi:hypothetical protein